MNTETLKKLSSDDHYYGEFGKQFLSNSDIDALINNPRAYGIPKEKTSAMLKGSYFHHALLEPKKLVQYSFVDVGGRGTKKYKEAIADLGVDMLLLVSEKEELDAMVGAAKKNFTFCSEIYADGNVFESASIKLIMGHLWKGKADVVGSDKIIDVKTTSRIEDFKFSARKYNYDSQAWVYNQLFGKPLDFYVIEKGTFRMKIFECSEEFLERGKGKVIEAVKSFERFFGENPTEDIGQFISTEILY